MIDDEFMNRVFFQQSLKKMMIIGEVAIDGPSGLAKVMSRIKLIKESGQVVQNYKIIFIDYNMPQMLGT